MSSVEGILYTVVARNKAVLAEYNATSTQYSQVVKTILERIPPNNSKLSYAYDRNLYHYISENGVVFLCVAKEKFGRRIPFTFLHEIKSQFFSRFPSVEELDTLPKNTILSFSEILSREMTHYSRDLSADPIRQVQGEISQVKDIMVQNIERVLERGDRIDSLVDKTNNLNTAAFAFRKRSTALKRKLWWKNQKLMAMLISSIIV
ncbi:hypothetical protein BB558_007369, partial [Smittium angustum]